MWIKLFIFFSGLFFAFAGVAQNEGNIWYFGGNAGLDFSSGSPLPLTNGQINTIEGCATICGCDGTLLFYTDGMRVWNKNHVQMPNGSGLNGDLSSTQSGVVVPAPGSTTLYYLFTASATGGGAGINYSIIDMTLAGGLGDVTTKNVQLLLSAAEKISAVQKPNGIDYWVVTHTANTDEFYTYEVTSAGVNAIPIISIAGSTFASSGGIFGYLRFSPQGNKLASVHQNTYSIDLVNFDKNTGIVSSDFTIPPAIMSYTYGVEFSPDGTKLYIGFETSKKIYQYDLNAGTPAAIIATATLVATTTGTEFGALQLGPDGKLYCAIYNNPSLGVINNPNTAGTGCNYVDHAVGLGGKLSNLGLPNFNTSIFDPQPTITLSVSSQNNPTCFEASNGSAGVTVTGGTGTYTYSWSNGSTDQAIYNVPAGTYTVNVFGAGVNHCGTITPGSTSQIITITEPTVLVLTPQSTDAGCGAPTGSALVIVSGGTLSYQYSWSSGGTTNTENNLNAGNYTITVTDGGGCTKTSTITVNTNPALSIQTNTITPVNCNGGVNGAADINVSGGTTGYTYSWSNGQTTSIISGVAAGTYTVDVKDINNCSATQTIVITEPTALNLNTSSNPSNCGGANGSASVTVIGGVTNYSYSWSNNSTDQTATSLIAGIYTITITDANLCTATSTASVTNNGSGTLSVLSNIPVKCFGDNNGSSSVSMGSGTTPYTYSWSSGSTDATASDLTAGTYTVVVTDVNNCSASLTVHITEPGVLSFSTPSSISVSCNGGNDGSATVIINGGLSPYAYSWSNGNTTNNASNLSAATYTLSVSDVNNCTSTTTALITEPTAIILTPTSTNANCGLADGSVSVTANGGTSAYSYSWNTGGTTQTISNLASGTYTVTIIDSKSCSKTISAAIIDNGAGVLSIPIKTDIKCFGENNGQAAANINGGASPYTYSWSNGITTAVASSLTAGSYTVMVTDNYLCKVSTTVIISEPAMLSATTTSTNAPCGSASGTAITNTTGGTSGYTYSWNNGQTSSNATGLIPSTYTVIITDVNLCTTSVSVTIADQNNITANAGLDQTLCEGGSISLGASGGTNYSWSPAIGLNNPSIAAPTAQPTMNTSYIVTVTTGTCTDKDTIHVIVNNLPSADAGINHTIINGHSTPLQGSGGGNYQWIPTNSLSQNNIDNPIASPTATTTYTLKITDTNGCIAFDTVTVFVLECTGDIFIPTAFSPNGDGVNDVFYVRAPCLKSLSFFIYDRWGEKIFETTDSRIGWDGIYRAKEQNTAVFTYYLKAVLFTGQEVERKGNITLIR